MGITHGQCILGPYLCPQACASHTSSWWLLLEEVALVLVQAIPLVLPSSVRLLHTSLGRLRVTHTILWQGTAILPGKMGLYRLILGAIPRGGAST